MNESLPAALAHYADRFHAAVGDGHHVASPLGAWLLLALSAAASPGDERLADVLGMAPAQAAEHAKALLNEPHPLVAAATAVWFTDAVRADRLSAWPLPKATDVGPLPDQAALDAWARDHTYGMIEKFPIQIAPDVALLLGSALATRVSWTVPFEVGPAHLLGAGSPWAGRVGQVLFSPRTHRAFIADSRSAGRVIVHIGVAQDGLEVISVAGARDVPADRVIAAAHEELEPVSLYNLELGATELWEITDHRSQTPGAETCRAALPAWSVTSDHDLNGPAFGFGIAADLLAPLLTLPPAGFKAAQTATARYDRYGFEAAAVTGFAVMVGAVMQDEGMARSAHLMFGHPYAVVAVASPHEPGPWHRVPVFSAWVAEPDEADAAEPREAEAA